MPGIDASIIGRLETPKTNPLDTVGKLQGVTQGILQNRMLAQEVQGKEALGRAVTAHTNTETGETEWDKAAAALSQDPQGAWKLPEFAAAILDRKAKEIANATAQANLSQAELLASQKKYGAVGDWATSVAGIGAKDPQALTPQAIFASAKAGLLDTGFINPQNQAEADQLLSVMAQFGDDPKQNMDILKRIILQTRATTEGVGLVLGQPSQVDTGSEILIKQTSPLTGETRTDAVIPKERTPSEKATLIDVYDPVTKSMKKVPSGEIIGDMPTTGGSRAVQSQPALGAAEGASAEAQSAVKQAQELRAAADQVPNQQAALKNIRDVVGSFQPGAKTDWIYAAKALATQLGVAPPKMQDEVAAQEEFNKLATQFINQQVGQLGGTGTDAKLESAAKGTPNEFMSKEGIENVTSLMMGLNDALLAKNAAWQKWLDAGNGPETYGKFATQFNAIYNPRVFQAEYMSEKQKQLMMRNMSEKDREAFQRDWKRAKAAGWIK